MSEPTPRVSKDEITRVISALRSRSEWDCDASGDKLSDHYCEKAIALIESQQRKIARLTARASFLEGAKLRLAADNPTMGKSIAEVFDDIIKKRLSHE